jgi:hypothetical protein
LITKSKQKLPKIKGSSEMHVQNIELNNNKCSDKGTKLSNKIMKEEEEQMISSANTLYLNPKSIYNIIYQGN